MSKKELILIINLNFFLKREKLLRYLIAGFVNTVFNYLLGLLIYHLFYKDLGFFFYSFSTSILNVTFNFINYKFFAFKTKNNLFKEYFKYCLSSFTLIIISMICAFLLLEVIKINIYLTQFILISFCIVLSYFFNKNFVFKIDHD